MTSEKHLMQKVKIAACELTQTIEAVKFWHSQSEVAIETRCQQALATAAAQEQRTLSTAEDHQQQASEAAKALYEQAVIEATTQHDQAVTKATTQHDQAVTEATTQYEQAMVALTTIYQQAMETAKSTYEEQMLNILAQQRIFVDSLGLEGVDWKAKAWDKWEPSAEYQYPTALRLGEWREFHGQFLSPSDRLPLSALVPLLGQRGWLFQTSGAARDMAVQALQSAMLRLLAVLPPGKARFIFLDPVGLGQNVAPFMHLADYDEQLITGKAWTEPQQIEQRLADLTEHIENVIQKYLRNQYATILEYNTQAGEIAEPYRFLVVLDFPVNFSETAARRLVSIAQNGPRCGVYPLILTDIGQKLPYGFNMSDLEQQTTVFAWNNNRFIWEVPELEDYYLELDTPPEVKQFNAIVNAVGEAAKDANRVEVPFARIAPPEDIWWQGDSRAGLAAPLGPSGARKVQQFNLGHNTAQHVLVAGKTGSGKSTLLHTLITSLGLVYSPDELQFYLIDFKKGVEFKTYAVQQLPHARVIAIESEREFGLSVLQGLDAELKQRGELFRAQAVDQISDYRQKTNQSMPRLLLIVDEFQEFFVGDDALAVQASQILDRLVRQGRAFGIHVLLGSQTLAGARILARSTIDQMAVRIALQCTEADSRLILGEDNPAARLLSRPGEAIYNAMNGLIEGNNRFQVAWLPEDEHQRYLLLIRQLSEARHYHFPQPQIVFEGNAPSIVEQNRALNDLLSMPAWPTPARRNLAWLGDPIAIREPIAVPFRRQSGSNLLLVAQNQELTCSMITTALISLAAQHRPDGTAFYFLDLSAADAEQAEFFTDLVVQFPHTIKVGRRRQIPEFVSELVTETKRRLEADETQAPAQYLFLYGLQRARDLRQDDSAYRYSSIDAELPPSPAQQFPELLRDGPEVGIHTLIWCDTVTNLNRTLDRRILREFAMRVACQMSAEDSANLIDVPMANKLGVYRALFYDEETGVLEKFRPYGLPSSQWLTWAIEQMQEKQM